MKTIAVAVVLALLAGAAHAGGIDIKIVKDSIAAGPIDAQGFVVVRGAPGTVIGGMAPVRVMAQSKKTKQSAAGMVAPDGSFEVRIPSMLKDSIKLTFLGADGKKKDRKVKVEAMGQMLVPAPHLETVTEQVTLPAGAPPDPEPQLVPADAPPLPPPPSEAPSDAEIVEGERALDAAGMVE